MIRSLFWTWRVHIGWSAWAEVEFPGPADLAAWLLFLSVLALWAWAPATPPQRSRPAPLHGLSGATWVLA